MHALPRRTTTFEALSGCQDGAGAVAGRLIKHACRRRDGTVRLAGQLAMLRCTWLLIRKRRHRRGVDGRSPPCPALQRRRRQRDNSSRWIASKKPTVQAAARDPQVRAGNARELPVSFHYGAENAGGWRRAVVKPGAPGARQPPLLALPRSVSDTLHPFGTSASVTGLSESIP